MGLGWLDRPCVLLGCVGFKSAVDMERDSSVNVVPCLKITKFVFITILITAKFLIQNIVCLWKFESVKS